MSKLKYRIQGNRDLFGVAHGTAERNILRNKTAEYVEKHGVKKTMEDFPRLTIDGILKCLNLHREKYPKAFKEALEMKLKNEG